MSQAMSSRATQRSDPVARPRPVNIRESRLPVFGTSAGVSGTRNETLMYIHVDDELLAGEGPETKLFAVPFFSGFFILSNWCGLA